MTPTFTCRQCGTCCRWPGHVLLTKDDIRTIADALHISEETFIEQYAELAANRAQLTLKDLNGADCVFLKQDRCLIYHTRPQQCRDYPRKWTVAESCPGFGPSSSEHGKA